METVHAPGTPLAAYLEGTGEGQLRTLDDDLDAAVDLALTDLAADPLTAVFAPVARGFAAQKGHRSNVQGGQPSTRPISRIHYALSSAVNSRLGRADNARFLEHFRYIIVASQLLSAHSDQGCQPSVSGELITVVQHPILPSVSTSVFGAAATIITAFLLAVLVQWAERGRSGGRILLATTAVATLSVIAYTYIRRQWLRLLRRNSLAGVSSLTVDWEAFESTTGSALSLIQEVELVSRGYRLSTPLPPTSRVDASTVSRRSGRLRKIVRQAYVSVTSATLRGSEQIRTLVDDGDLDRYLDVYDVDQQDAHNALESQAHPPLDGDAESLGSLRVLSYRAGVVRRIFLCSLLAVQADGGKADFHRWRVATEAMSDVRHAAIAAVQTIRTVLDDMETIPIPSSRLRAANSPARDRLRGQVRKISALSSGIRSLQAKMQILRDDTSRSLEHTDDPADLGPGLQEQYDAIGADLHDLQLAWEAGKAALQTDLTRAERRVSGNTDPIRSSTASSIGGLTAVEEAEGIVDGGPAEALRALSGGTLAKRSSTVTAASSDEEMVFEAVALPRQRPSTGLSRNERIAHMHEERERQATLRARREADTSMLRELESVISLRPGKKIGSDVKPVVTLV